MTHKCHQALLAVAVGFDESLSIPLDDKTIVNGEGEGETNAATMLLPHLSEL